MSVEPIDPTPFEDAMPESVRAVIAQARSGEGPAKEWLVAGGGGWGQVGTCFGMIRSVPEALPPEIVGWLVGIAMFGDDLHVLPRMMVRERTRPPATHVLDAFAAGIRTNVPTMARQWKGIEDLLVLVDAASPAFLAVLADGIASDQALARGVALRIAQKLGAPARAALEERAGAGDWGAKEKRRLDDALAALEAGHRDESAPHDDADDLLVRLLAAWATTKDPELGDAIVRVGAKAARGREPLKARSKGELEGTWLALAVAHDPVDVDRLLNTPWPGAWKTALARVRELRNFPPDPRILRRLLEVASLYESWGSHPLHTAMAGLHARWVDPSLPDAIRAEMARRGTYAPREYTNALAAIEACEIGKAEPALLDEVRRTAEPERDLASLWTWFYEAPHEPERRLVLADALQAAGDPRGELIVLQAAIANGTGDAKMRRRANAIVEANMDTLSGHLPSIERGSRRFERGFLVAVHASPTAQALEQSLDHREWRTIEELVLNTSGSDVVKALVPRLPCLRTLVLPDDATISALAAGAPLPSVVAIGCCEQWIPDGSTPGFPNLSVMAGRWLRLLDDRAMIRERVAALAKSGVRAVVHTSFDGDFLAEVIRAADEVGPIETRFVTAYKWTDIFDPQGWRVRVRRNTTDADVAWGGGGRSSNINAILQLLAAAGRKRIRVHVARSVKDEALEAAKQISGAEITLDGEPFDLAAPPV